jgi:hypothetical protein
MKRVFLASSILTIALVPLRGAVDPTLLGLVMPDATVVAGVQVAHVQGSPFGQHLLSQIVPNSTRERERLFAATGFDPLKDLQEVVFSSGGSTKGLALGRGFFQPGRIAVAAAAHGATVIQYNGFDILSGASRAGHEGDGALVFLDASLVAIGDQAAVRAVVDRRAAGTLFSGDLAQRAKQISGTNDAWVVTLAPAKIVPGTISDQSTQARVFQSVKQVSGGLRFGSAAVSISAEALTASNQDAQALADVLQFLAGMAQGDPKGSQLLASAKFTVDGATTRITLDVPEAQIEQLLMDHGPRTQRRAVRVQR